MNPNTQTHTAHAVEAVRNGADDQPLPSLKPVGDAVAQEGAKAASLARHLWEQSADGCQQALDQVARGAKALDHRGRAYVRQEPAKAVMFAAAAGALVTGLAMMLSRRR